ncbi:Uncharacterised protein [Metamycoplasma arthritidis]|uniref:APC family permease n=1 Tax=Metamycoplasma arthritidis TaxID=2111 RepID=UPI001004DD93|nr:APC family permease [Metamycoplasma arthritidis]VEU79023.1 Uncharacterised protein [Metamycoplasma arthritidis]
MNDEQMVVTSDNKKKISFFSAILIVIGGSIGAGIFLRSKSVLSNSAGNIVWAIAVWLIAGFAIIAMALALVEVASGRNDNLGMIGWAKAFNKLFIYKGVKFFMTYLYLPFTYFFMPYYVIIQFQDGLSGLGVDSKIWQFGNTSATPWIFFAIGLAITVWMMFTAGISSRAGNIQNWVVTAVKFIPLVAIVIIGFAFAAKNGVTYKAVTKADLFSKDATTLFGLSPFFAVFGSLGGIFFAFDGFYVTAGVQSEMEKPEKTPAALTIGLSSITLIYIIIALAMTLGAKKGDFYDYGSLLKTAGHSWAFGVVNICIAIGIIGILNGFTMWATRFVEDLIKEGEISVPVSAYKYMLNAKRPWVGMIFCLVLSVPYMIILTAIGTYAYIGGGYYDDGEIYGKGTDKLLTFADLMADWMAVFAFAFIALAIVGAIQNRKKNFIAVTKNKHTIWAGYTSVIIVLITLTFMILDKFVGMGLSINQYLANTDASKTEGLKSSVIGNTTASVLFLLYIAVSFAFIPLERKMAERKEIKLNETIASGQGDMEKLRLAKEMNDAILRTYREAR